MHRNGHWFSSDKDGQFEVCQLCGLKVPMFAGTVVIRHVLAKAGKCPVTNFDDICEKLGFELKKT